MALDIITYNDEKVDFRTEDNRVIFNGKVDRENPEAIMEPFIKDVHENVVNKGIKEIEIDLRGLEFLNSSGIREFVNWIVMDEGLEDDKKYKITFLCNPLHTWQEASIKSLTYLNMELVESKNVE